MNILLAAMSMDIGGAETHVCELALALKANGEKVFVVSSGGSYEALLQQNGIQCVYAPLNSKRPTALVRALFVIKKLIKEQKIDVLHAHARIPALVCSWAKCRKNAFVTTVHGAFVTPLGYKLLSNWGQRALAVSHDLKKYLVEQYHVAAQDVQITVNGVDTAKFSPYIAADDIVEKYDLLGCVRLVSVSRLEGAAALPVYELIKAAPRLREQYPNIKILIVGDGSEYGKIRMLAENLPFVYCVGATTEVNKFLAVADVVLAASRAALEALACEKLCVLSGFYGHVGLFTAQLKLECMENNFTCRGHEPATAEKIYKDISQAIDKLNSAEQKKLVTFGRELVKENYSVERMANDAVAAYNAALYPKKYGVVLSGYYGFGNAGDDALLCTIIQQLQKTVPQVNITVLSMKPHYTRRDCGVKAVFRFNPFAIRHAMKRASLLINGGGSLIQDVTSSQSLKYYLWIMNIAHKLGLKTMLYANGIGPVIQQKNYDKVKKTLDKINLITLRDHESAVTLKKLGVENKSIYVTADPIFAPLDKANIPLPEGNYIVVAVRSWQNNPHDFIEVLSNTISQIAKKYMLNVVFLPFQRAKDLAISNEIAAKLGVPSVVPQIEYTSAEILGVIGGAKLVLGMRLHSLIFAVTQNVPCVAISYDPKVTALMDMLNSPSCIEVENVSTANLINLIENELLCPNASAVQIIEKLHGLAQQNAQYVKTLLT